MPFRSEAEQIREQVRRLDEQAGVLREQHADLERQVAQRERTQRALLIALGIIVVAGGIGYGAGSIWTSAQQSRRDSVRASNEAMEAAEQEASRRECQQTHQLSLSDLNACQKVLADRQRNPPEPPPTPCRCAPKDPLCNCPFDKGAAARELAVAQVGVTACIAPIRTVSFHTTITFRSSTGAVEKAVIDSPAQGELSDVERKCLAKVLRNAKVPPFSGGEVVMVGKTFSVRPAGGEPPPP